MAYDLVAKMHVNELKNFLPGSLWTEKIRQQNGLVACVFSAMENVMLQGKLLLKQRKI